jgi:HPt (histidine-containing phosphotransfer) domain-containing protein
MFDQLKEMPLLDDAQLDSLREALGEDDLHAMLSDLPQAALQTIDLIRGAVHSNDLDEVRRSAHVLKGVASSFGAARLAAMARELELETPTIDGVANCVPDLIETVERTATAFGGGAARPLDQVAS